MCYLKKNFFNSENKFSFGKSGNLSSGPAILQKHEILNIGISCYLSIEKMLEIINIFIPNFVRKYKNNLCWERIEKILFKKYQESPTNYDKQIQMIIMDVYSPRVYLPKTLGIFFNIFVTAGKLVEIMHAIILFPLLSNLLGLAGIFKQIRSGLLTWSRFSLIFAFNAASFDNICT